MEMHLNKRLLDAAWQYPTGPRPEARADTLTRVNGNTGQRANGDTDLTRRQLQVLALLVKGEPNKTIARALGITEGTVKIHLTAIFKALRVQNRIQAAVATVSAALRPHSDSEAKGRGSVRGWPGRHPFDNTGCGDEASMRFPGPFLRAVRDV